MLWYKAWLETRFRILFLLVWFLSIVLLASFAPRGPNPAPPERVFGFGGVFWFIIPVMLAGAGIKTQASFTATKGLHESIHFTLSLPVSRFRLVASRAGLGFLETVGVVAAMCFGAWVALPTLRTHFTLSDALEYVVVVVLCGSAFYSLGVLLAVYLDDIWQIWSSMSAILILRLSAPWTPPSVNLFRAVAEASPLFTHTIPWASMCVSAGASVILLAAAVKAAQAREY